MTIEEAISQLEYLRRDRQSFCNGDPDDDEIWNADIEAIDVALKQMQENAELKRLLKLAVEDLESDSTVCDKCKKLNTDECDPMNDCSCYEWRYLDEAKGLIEDEDAGTADRT